MGGNLKKRNMTSLFKCKKATLLDFIYLSLTLFAFAIISIVLYPVFVQVNLNMNQSGQVPADVLVLSTDIEEKYVGITDGIFLLILIGLSVAALIGAMMINTHPAFYFVIASLLAFFAIINAILANAFSEVVSSGVIAEHSDKFIITVFVMQNFPFVILVISFIVAIVLLAKGGGFE